MNTDSRIEYFVNSRINLYTDVFNLDERNLDKDELSKQFRDMSFKLHPDKNYGDGDHATKSMFQQLLKDARDILIDDSLRRRYNHAWAANYGAAAAAPAAFGAAAAAPAAFGAAAAAFGAAAAAPSPAQPDHYEIRRAAALREAAINGPIIEARRQEAIIAKTQQSELMRQQFVRDRDAYLAKRKEQNAKDADDARVTFGMLAQGPPPPQPPPPQPPQPQGGKSKYNKRSAKRRVKRSTKRSSKRSSKRSAKRRVKRS